MSTGEATERLYSALCAVMPKKQLFQNASMREYTTLQIGGSADLLCKPASVSQLSSALTAAKNAGVEITLMGNGSNLLVRDGGIRGLVIQLGKLFSDISDPVPLSADRFALTAQTGAPLRMLCERAAEHGLTGLEFASGIPGTVGGAVYMNAGAYGGEMKDVVSSVMVCGPDGWMGSFSNSELHFGYRSSRLSEADTPLAAASVTVILSRGDEETIRATMREFAARRREKQPIGVPSCGSTFKRPEGQFAGTLIDQCGLKGLRVGGASVSTLHAGFLVNDSEGTASDYLALIARVQKAVLEQTGVALKPEVRIVGEDIGPETV